MTLHLSYPEVTVAVATFVIIFMFIKTLTKKYKSPPGPWGLPVFGSFFQLGELPHITLAKMKKQYGDVFLIKLGNVPVVVVNGQETIKKVLVKQGESFAARPKLYSLSLFSGPDSFIFSPHYGETVKQLRKTAKNAMQMFTKAEAKTSTCSCVLEDYVTTEAMELVNTLGRLTEKDGFFNPNIAIASAVTNVVCALCFGTRYGHTDKDLDGFMDITDEAHKSTGFTGLVDFIPLLRYLPLPGLKSQIELQNQLRTFIKKHITEHYSTYDENYVRDITDALVSLCEKKRRKDNTSLLTDDQILTVASDIFGAGFSTTQVALHWIILYLLQNPESQVRIQKEIDENIGDNRAPRFEDRKELHYTESFINEVFRHTSFMPLSVPHCTTKDVYLNGYFIPRDTCVFINHYQVNHDPSIWADPETFIPDRFLDEDGKFNRSLQEKVHLFGMGTRVCLGEDIARNEIFLIVASILQRLKLEHNVHESLDLTPLNGMSLKPKQFKLKVVQRT
ncbi:cytochrome P450 1A1-like [Ambystoma mexicanum]|uniref:cytochrome P450 1A1-like n=1 Tax=Ambystoma mexicanum TaxID=8296 RepID=UPI0037E76580